MAMIVQFDDFGKPIKYKMMRLVQQILNGIIVAISPTYSPWLVFLNWQFCAKNSTEYEHILLRPIKELLNAISSVMHS